MLTIAVVLCLTAVAAAQDEPRERQVRDESGEQTFRLQRDSATAARELEFDDEAQRWKPRVDQGTIEVSLSLGFLNLNTTLLEHEQIVYKYTQENTYFGDVAIKGQTAFSPVLRLGANISRWFALEGQGGLSFSDYTTSIENRKYQKNEPEAPIISDPPLGEFDAEQRSLLTGQAAINAVVYPFNIRSRVTSRVHPFVTGGIERFWFNMNSNYVDDTASAWGANLGAGIRLLADENVSVRFEVVFHRTTLEWTPAESFTELNDGTLPIPLEDWPAESLRRPVTEFTSHDLNLLNWSIGVQGTF
ncbi:MAG: hypothetical protein R6X35_10085 [Candidatus Krumholzibacteriia bacterium]